jgi:hypothetical protein
MHRIGARKGRHFGHKVVTAESNCAQPELREEIPMNIFKTALMATLVSTTLFTTACTYSDGGCLIGHYCLIPVDGGSAKSTDWLPTDHASGPVEEVAARCDMIAHGTEPADSSVIAIGKPAFVGGVMAGSMLVNGMNKMGHVQDTIKDCMIMNGFRHIAS